MDIKTFQNASLFLQQYYANRKAQNPDFSYDVWAKELGLKSRSYLRLVVIGHRPINADLILAFTNFFGFVNEEAEYFSTLVHYSQAKNNEQRLVFGRKLTSLISLAQERLEVCQHYDFLSDIALPRLQTICGFEDAPQDKEKLSEICGLTQAEVTQKIMKLEELGLLKDQKPLRRNWKVAASGHALGHREFYRQTLQQAEKAMDLPFDERKFRALFVAMNPEEFGDFMKDFEIFAKEQLQKRGSTLLSGRRLYQLGFHFFPTSQTYRQEEDKKDLCALVESQ